jgi:RimJ/RimL family protein N-acetyltransferase
MADLFRGPRVRLAAPSRADVPTLVRWHDDPELLRLWDSSAARPKSEEALNAWLDGLLKDKESVVLAIRPAGGDSLLGLIDFDGIEWTHGAAYVGIVIGDRCHWGQGYGTEAMGLALRYAFQELNLHRLSATVFDYNPRSIALFESAGFTREGVFREFVLRDGRRHDMLLFGLLRHEWEARSGLTSQDTKDKA